MDRADRALIRRANKEVSVFDVLEKEFSIRHPREGRSYKGYCPFAFEHPDGGVEKGFRTYPGTNTAYCFVLHGSLNPVRIVELKEDVPPLEAARKLLSDRGLLEPKDVMERWNDALRANERGVELGDPQVLVEALQEFLRTHPAYAEQSLSPRFMGEMEVQLNVLDRVLDDPRVSESIVRAWFSKAKVELQAVLDELYAGAEA
jgi:hypothetical protein